MRFSRTVFICIILCSLLSLIPAICLSSSDSADDECDFNTFYEIYGDAYYACEETQHAIAEYTASCFDSLKMDDIRRMARICYMCDFHEDDNCIRYIDVYDVPKDRFNEVHYLEAIYNGDEKGMLIQLELLEKHAGRANSEVWRNIASGYDYYGDTEKAIQILEFYIIKAPDNLRIANDLASLYLSIGNFDKAEYYADYYRSGDASWPGPDIIKAEVSYYRGDLHQAWSHLLDARDTGTLEGQAPFWEGKYYVAEGSYDDAYKAFENVEGHSRIVSFLGNDRWFLDVAAFYMEIYNQNEGDIPEISELEQMAESLDEDEEYYEAAKYYYLCRMMEPDKGIYLYKTGLMLERAGNISEAVSYYSIYLALNPDAEEEHDINKFIKSRKTKPFDPRMSCSDYLNSKKCTDAEENCYWNTNDSKCYDKVKSCFEYYTSNSCNRAPAMAECYWNTGMQQCVSRGKGCFYYKDRSSCQAALQKNGACVWDEKGNSCKNR